MYSYFIFSFITQSKNNSMFLRKKLSQSLDSIWNRICINTSNSNNLTWLYAFLSLAQKSRENCHKIWSSFRTENYLCKHKKEQEKISKRSDFAPVALVTIRGNLAYWNKQWLQHCTPVYSLKFGQVILLPICCILAGFWTGIFSVSITQHWSVVDNLKSYQQTLMKILFLRTNSSLV